MNQYLLQKNKYFLIGLVVVSVLLITFISLLVFSLTDRSQQTTLLPSPTPAVQLSQQELTYPEAAKQPFYSDNSGKTGTLIVSSPLSDIRVMIDDGEVESAQETVTYPIQKAPFKITDIPTGRHTLRAAKPGYVFQTIPFAIKPGEITRLEITLQPIRSVE